MREIVHMQAGQCGNQMGNQILEVVCNENGIGGGGERCGDNDAQLDRISLIYHDASGGKCFLHAVLFDFEPGAIGAITLSRRSPNFSAWITS